MTLKELAVVIRLDAAQFQSGIKEAANSIDQFGHSVNKSKDASSILANSMRALGGDVSAGFTAAMGITANVVSVSFDIIKKATLGLATLLAGSTIEASRFTDAIDGAWRQASNGANSAGREYEKFAQTAINIGKDSEFSAIAIAKAMNLIADNARDVSQTEEEVAWAAKLASATNNDLAVTSNLVSKGMMIFGEKGMQASQISNYLATMVDRGAVSLNDMGMAFRTLMPMASAMGWEFKDVGAVLGVLSTKGIEGFRAIFALQSILDSALDPTKGLGKELAAVGVQVVDTSGKVMPLIEIIEQMKNLGWSTQEIYKRFGTQMGTVFSTMMQAGPQAFKEFGRAMELSSVSSQTYIDEQEEMLRKKLPYALKELQSAADTSLVQIGGSFAKELTPVLQLFKDWVNQIGDAVQNSELLPGIINLLTESLAPAKEGITNMVKALGEWMKNVKSEDIQKSFSGMATYITTAAEAVKVLADNLSTVVGFLATIAEHAPIVGGFMAGSKFGPAGAAIGAGAGALAENSLRLLGPEHKKMVEKGPEYQMAFDQALAGQGYGQSSAWDLFKTQFAEKKNETPTPKYVEPALESFSRDLQSSLSRQLETQGKLTDVVLVYAEQSATLSANSAEELREKLNGIIKTWKSNMDKPKSTESIH